jgi:hypothetical protein
MSQATNDEKHLFFVGFAHKELSHSFFNGRPPEITHARQSVIWRIACERPALGLPAFANKA